MKSFDFLFLLSLSIIQSISHSSSFCVIYLIIFDHLALTEVQRFMESRSVRNASASSNMIFRKTQQKVVLERRGVIQLTMHDKR